MMMMKVSKRAGRWGAGVGLAAAVLVLAGCHSGAKFSELPGASAGTTGGGETASATQTPAPPATVAKAPPATVAKAPPATVTKATTQVSNPPVPVDPAGSDDIARTLDTIEVNESLVITFFDLPNPLPPIEQQVKQDGTITLIQNQTFMAAGKTRGQLEAEIRTRYVPDYFPTMTVNVAKKQDKFYYVGGEVKLPGRQIYIGRLRVLAAIKSAGDFTDFAKRTAVELTRMDGRKYTIDAKKAIKDPKLDIEVLPGDQIRVPRRINPFTH